MRVARGEATKLSADDAGKDLVDLGRAMQLAYLGARQGTQAPDVIEGWMSDKAIEDPRRTAVEARLLLTKNELATMAALLSGMTDAGEAAKSSDDANAFFTQVHQVMAQMAQDPKMIIDANSESAGGALEFLEDLPYQSQLMAMTEQRWGASAMKRREILDTMRQKLAQYRKWLLDPTVWTSLYEGSPDGEYVFAVPFDVLP